MLYLDAAATSMPKPVAVAEAMSEYLIAGANPGRSGHRMSRWAEEQIWRTRESLAGVFLVKDPDRVVLGLNATMMLNSAIHHLSRRGGRVLTSAWEHNSVTRPLFAQVEQGLLRHEVIPGSVHAPVDLEWLATELEGGGVSGVVMTWASNVTGCVLPVEAVSALCRMHGVLLIIDAAQAAGYIPVEAGLADVLVFAGHKGLGGPQGVGGAVIADGIDLDPFLVGGSGGRSENQSAPRWLPWSQEAGTPNGPGIAGLGAAVAELSVSAVRERQARLSRLRALLDAGLRDIAHIQMVDPAVAHESVPVLSFTVEGVASSRVGEALEEDHDVLVRTGLHCAPLAHHTLGTIEGGGTVRISLSATATEGDVDAALEAVGATCTKLTKEIAA
ncbi:aminotransferase class V-fold PLP-dependent enzyme [Microbacterium sp. 22215]|uniref:aminotransferase class V-fold PLP-dependent enzyme n=1 Tax=Microbacterium sp. 22215 TaxID=3453893 RepID=UPI003F82A6D7